MSYSAGLLAQAIYGMSVGVEGRCCDRMHLSCIDHPLYRCSACGAKVKMKKVVKVRITVVKESPTDDITSHKK